jgi:hypothetical protein
VDGGGCFGRELVSPQWREGGDNLELERDGWFHGVLGMFHDGERSHW